MSWIIEVFQENINTEQEGKDDEQEVGNDQPQQQVQPLPYMPCYTGKDKFTEWKIHCIQSKTVRTPRQIIVIHLPGVKQYTKQAKTPIDCWSLFFDEEMLNVIKNLLKTKKG